MKPWLRVGVGAAALALASLAGYGRRHEVADATGLFGGVDLVWLGVAVGCQTGSMFVFARLQRWLLRAGGAEVGLGQMVEITLAANALGTSLPGGAAWSGTWAFNQLRRRGADPALTVWVLLVAGALASFALFVLLAIGSWIAGPAGPAAHVRLVTAILAAIPVAIALILYAARRSPAIRGMLARSWRTIEVVLPGAPWLTRTVAGLTRRLGMVRPRPLGWLEAFAMALANWVLDALCLAFALLALHVSVPWPDILFIYAVTQAAASLPITPGGLGVVEGSLAFLLIAYHVASTGAFAGVLLYRIASFWVLVPLGWIIWLVLETAIRSGVRTRPIHGPCTCTVPTPARTSCGLPTALPALPRAPAAASTYARPVPASAQAIIDLR